MARTKRSRRSYGAGRMGPEPGPGVPGSEDRPVPDGVARERAQAHPVAGAPRMGEGETAGGRVRRRVRWPGPERKARAEPEPLTLGGLLDIYGEEVTPAKGEGTRKYDRVTLEMFGRFFGRDRRPATLSQRDRDRFIRARRAGKVGPSGRPVSDRTIERDLRFLLAVLNWATRSRDEAGARILDSNPLKGLRVPRDKNPIRVVLSQANTTPCSGCPPRSIGVFAWRSCSRTRPRHRIGAIRQLRWSDVNMGAVVIRWRAAHEKTGFEHRTPVTAEALGVLEEARRENRRTGDAPVLPAPRDPDRSMSHGVAR